MVTKKKKVRYLSVVIRGKIIRVTESTKMDQQQGTREQKKKIQLKKKLLMTLYNSENELQDKNVSIMWLVIMYDYCL